MKKTILLTAFAAISSLSSFGAACVNGALSSQVTCEISTGNGGTFQLSSWTLTDPSLDGRRVSTTLRQSVKEFTEYRRLLLLVC
jgi:hypothetical protein